jgi:hypothetical protein
MAGRCHWRVIGCSAAIGEHGDEWEGKHSRWYWIGRVCTPCGNVTHPSVLLLVVLILNLYFKVGLFEPLCSSIPVEYTHGIRVLV